MIPESLFLPALIALPVVGGFLCWQGERINRGVPRWIAFFSMLGVFVLSLYLWWQGGYDLPTGDGQTRWRYEVN
jgi:NADH-quinone oxidoreductase subunit M